MPDSGFKSIYQKLYAYFGPQAWWPADSAFEVIVGAILTQNTNWQNVEKAIANLKNRGFLKADKLRVLPASKLALLIRPAGYFNIKARRLKNFMDFFFQSYSGDLAIMRLADTQKLRQELLSVNGIGEETADSILLYALNKPVFVVDAYTKRVLWRHRFSEAKATYQEVQNFFMKNLKKEVKLFNEYHALIVRLGKEFCRKSNPRCTACPLKDIERRSNLCLS